VPAFAKEYSMPSNAIPKPTAAELSLLRALWPLQQASVKQMHEALQSERPDWNYASVLRLMQVMHSKGLLLRDESQRSHVYRPAQQADSLRTNLLTDLIHKAFAGSGKALVLAALKDHVSAKERADIQKILDGESP
jgi:predicted transcriptional regulator